MKMKSYPSFAAYLADQPARNQRIIRALRSYVKRSAPRLEESVKWGNGCWLLGKHPVAYVYSAPDHVQFGFLHGAKLEDPRGLLRGEGKYVRHIRLTAPSELHERAFTPLLRQAVRAAAAR
ncbi:MAG TPA: DUF1801 domain-containing protein [Gemmatimonadales bacterium]|nr:DUF1801 domain-containing protein [Gemmatimonadales bacterium]